MGYRNDQFYKLRKMTGELGGSVDIVNGTNHWTHSADNPTFIYPNRDIRVYDKDGNPETKLLKRGFMRNIPRLEAEPQFKCQFQFNPQTLTQDVNYSESVYNHYLRDPGSFAQPQAGNGTMAFTLLFDRSMEINNPVGTGGPTYDPARGGYVAVDGNAKPDIRNPWETGAPQYVGVLRDIAALYSVIGQGVNKTELAGQLEAAQTFIKSEAAVLGPDSEQGVGSDEFNKAMAQLNAAFKQQVGNYAFLAPKPVRMVFSSLYIVEGYVTSSSVTFAKFNSAYVPIQAQVHLTMSVQHIGFAKPDTYTTYAIEEAKKLVADQEEAIRQDNLAAYQPAVDELGSWKVFLNGDNSAGTLSPIALDDNPLTGGPAPNNMWIGMTSSDTKFEEVKALFDSGNTTIDIRAEFYMWADLDVPPNPADPDSISPKPDVQLYFWKPTVTNKDQFEDVIGNGNLVGGSVPVQTINSVAYGDGNWAYQFKLNIQLTHNGSRLTGADVINARSWVGNGLTWSDPFLQFATLNWTPSGDPISTSPLTPQIELPSAGSPSYVGGRRPGRSD